MRFTDQQLKEILNRVDIVDVISRYQPLERKSKEFVGVCPFHDDHSPSMNVSPDKQIFKCFACGAGGNAFSYVRRIENISFASAVAKVAHMAGIEVSVSDVAPAESAGPQAEAHKLLNDYVDYVDYDLSTVDGQVAREYCEKRKIDSKIIKDFQIGWAPDVKSQEHYFKTKGFSPELLEKVGLTSERGRPVFDNRLMIPIHDRDGRPVAFTARTLSKDPDIPKYVNTTGTFLYTKGDVVFNYHRAKEVCHKAGRVILVEGAMDVIGLAKAGITEGVANLGTACTPRQLDLLKQLQVPVYVFYDSDDAGQKAAYHFGQMAMKAHLPFVVVREDKDKDPDEIFSKRGAKALKEAVNRTESYPEFLEHYLADTLDLENYEDRKSYGQQVSEAAWTLLKEFERDPLLKRVQARTGLDFSKERPVPRQATRRKGIVRPVAGGHQKAEELMVRLMLESQSYARRFRDEIGYFEDEDCAALALYIYDGYRNLDSFDPQMLFGQIEEASVQGLLARLLDEPVDEDTDELFEDGLARLKDHIYESELEKLNEKVRQTKDADEKMELAKQKAAIVIARHKLRQRKEGR